MSTATHSANNPPEIPSASHWLFGVCRGGFTREPFKTQLPDIVVAVNAQGNYPINGGPAKILSLPTASERAEVTFRLLMRAFANRDGALPDSALQFSKWSTNDPAMAAAIEQYIKDDCERRGSDTKQELRKVHVCTAKELEILEAGRENIIKKYTGLFINPAIQAIHDPIEPGDTTKCHGCGLSRDCFFQPFKRCARCGDAFYHSRQCQKKHWGQGMHSVVCEPPDAIHALHASEYYLMKAPADPAARQLMRSLKVEGLFRKTLEVDDEIPRTLHRLVFTGQDTPEKMRLLFGPNHGSADMKKIYEAVRLGFLVDPHPNSEFHGTNDQYIDPSLVRSLRPVMEAEEERIKEVKQMKALIELAVGAGKSPEPADREAILAKFHSDPPTKLENYAIALNTMDKGVPAG